PPLYGQSQNTWHRYIAEYMDLPNTTENPFRWADTYTREPTVFDCPGTMSAIAPLPGHTGTRLNARFSDGLNTDLPQRVYNADRRSGVNVSVADLEAPSQTMAIMETTDFSARYTAEIGNGSGQAVIPHGGGQNVGFYDGSVKRMSAQELIATQPTDTFWRGGY